VYQFDLPFVSPRARVRGYWEVRIKLTLTNPPPATRARVRGYCPLTAFPPCWPLLKALKTRSPAWVFFSESFYLHAKLNCVY